MRAEGKLKIYIFSIFLASSIGCIYYFKNTSFDWILLFPMLILSVTAEFFKIKIIINNTDEIISISWTSVITIGTYISLGVPSAIIVNVLASIVSSIYPYRLDIIKTIYNVSTYVLTIILTDILYRLLSGYFPNMDYIVNVITISIIYTIINYTLATILMKLVTLKNIKEVITDIITPHIPHSIMLSVVGGILGVTYKYHMISALMLSLLFVYLIIYSLKATTKIANKRIKELDRTLEELIQALSSTIDARDPYVYGHSMQVCNYAIALANEFNLSYEEKKQIRIAGLLHDIGKISISESILLKEGKLTNEEFRIIKQHCSIGEEILAPVSSLSEVAKLIGMHHERYDGKGYPLGLKGDEIPIGAYILGVADTLDAILSDRSYQKARSVKYAMSEFKRCSGTQFNTEVVEKLLSLHKRVGDKAFINSAILIDKSIIKRNINSRDNKVVSISI